MRDEDRSAVSAARSFGKESIARLTRRSFDRHFLFFRERANVCRAELKFNAASRCRANASLARPPGQAARLLYFLVVVLNQLLNKPPIRIARSSPQLMIQMANDEVFVTQT